MAPRSEILLHARVRVRHIAASLAIAAAALLSQPAFAQENPVTDAQAQFEAEIEVGGVDAHEHVRLVARQPPGQFAADPAYSVNTPLDTGSLKCRTLHAVRARGGNLDACVDAFSADAECPGNPLQ